MNSVGEFAWELAGIMHHAGEGAKANDSHTKRRLASALEAGAEVASYQGGQS